MKFISQGLTNKQVSEEMRCSLSRIKNVARKILDKLGFHNRVEIAMWYVKKEYEAKLNNKISPDSCHGSFPWK